MMTVSQVKEKAQKRFSTFPSEGTRLCAAKFHGRMRKKGPGENRALLEGKGILTRKDDTSTGHCYGRL